MLTECLFGHYGRVPGPVQCNCFNSLLITIRTRVLVYLHHYLAWVLSGILLHGFFLFGYICIRDGDFIRARTLEYGMLVPEHLVCLFLGVAVVTLHVQAKFTLLFDVLPLFQVSTPILPCVFFLHSSSDCPSSNRTFPGQGRSILEVAVNPEDRTYSSEIALQHF